MFKRPAVTLLAAMMMVSTAALAEDAASDEEAGTLGIGLKVGTLGPGVDLTFGLTRSLGVRLNLNKYDYTGSTTESDIRYDANINLDSQGVILDWHPFAGGFHLSAGYMLNKNRLGLTATPTGGTYTINGVDYSAAAVGSLTGEVKFNDGAYVALGWAKDGVKKGFGLTFEIGAILQQKPAVSLTASNATVGSALAADIKAEEQQAADALNKLGVYPQVSLGLSYTF